jgi:autotransporter-associated beta strand protein
MATKTSRPRLGFLIAAAFALSASVLPTKVKAADLYFDGAAGGTYPSLLGNSANWVDALSNPAFPSLTGDSLFFGYGSSSVANTFYINNLAPGYSFTGITFADLDGLGSRQLAGGLLTTDSVTTIAGAGVVNISSPIQLTGLAPVITAGVGSNLSFTSQVATDFPLATLTVTGAGNTTITGSLQAFALDKDGGGSLSLGSTLYQSDFINVIGGTLSFTQSNVVVDSVVTNDADLLFTNAAGTAQVFSLGGAASGFSSFAGNAAIGARSGSGYLNLAGNSSILSLSGSGPINTALNKTLDLSEGSFSGDLTGDGSIKKVSAGTLTLSGDNSGLSADFEIFDGVVRAESLDALGSGAVTIKLTGGDLTLVSDVNQIRANDVVVSADTTIKLEAFTPATLSLTQTLGDLTMRAYTLNVAQGINFDLGATATLAFGNVTLDSSGGISTFDVGAGAKLTTGSVSALANESLVVTGAGDTTIGGTFGLDTGSLTKNGNGTLTLDGSIAGSWVGTTTVNAGTLEFTQAVTLNGAVANDATLLFSDNAGTTILTSGLSGSGSTTFAGDGLIRVLTGTSTSTLNFASLNAVGVGSGNFAGLLAGSGTFRKVSDGTFGAGTLVLTGNNVGLTGVVDVAAGTLQVESVDGLGSATVQLTGGNLNLVGDQNLNLGNDVQQTSISTITIGAATPGSPSLT